MHPTYKSARPAWLSLAAALALVGCTDASSPDRMEAPEHNAGGKADTGYLSNVAAEIEGVYRGTVSLDVSTLDADARTNLASDWENGNADTIVLIDQISFGKNQFNSDLLHVNLVDDQVTIAKVTLEEDVLEVQYEMIADAVVSHEELRKANVKLEDLVGGHFEALAPADPRNMTERVGRACADAEEDVKLEDWNYFYYFDPTKEECTIPMATVTLDLRQLHPPVETYPEYDRLIADGKVEAVVFFGAAKYDEVVADNDWGMRAWREFEEGLAYRGFAKASLGQGTRWTRSRNGLEEIVDVFGPEVLIKGVDDIFATELKTKEIILYNGHSGYGSLGVLDDRDNYPEGKYQVLMMNSCWSYEYYTKQVFQNKATAADPKGWADADVINNTEVGWFSNLSTMSTIVLENLLAGAEYRGQTETTDFDWTYILTEMNAAAVDAYKTKNLRTHEIFGASGVRTNAFRPE